VNDVLNKNKTNIQTDIRTWKFHLIIFLLSVSIFIFPDDVFATTIKWINNDSSPTFSLPEYYISDQTNTGNLVSVQVLDGPKNGIDSDSSISVTLKSDDMSENVEVEARETTDGTYETGNIIFTIGHAVFNIGSKVDFNLDFSELSPDDLIRWCFIMENFSCDPTKIDVFSTHFEYGQTKSSVDTLALNFTETEPDSKTFSISFMITSDDATGGSELKAKPGDVVTISSPIGTLYGFVNDPNSTKSAISVVSLITFDPFQDPIGTVTASYDTIEDSIIIKPEPPGGGLGGPSGRIIVVDSPKNPNSDDNNGSGCDGDCSHPTLGIDENYNRIVNNGFSYNDNPLNVELYYTPYPLITVNVGEENLTVLKIYDNGGTENIEHVGLGFGLGKGESFNDSKATINLDRTFFGEEKVTTYDPEHVFDNVRVTTEKDYCGISTAQCLVVKIYHTFREPLDFNMVATYVWDFKRNSWQNYYNHGIEIVGKSLNPPKQFNVLDRSGYVVNLVEINKTTAVDKDGFVWDFDSQTNSWHRDDTHNHIEVICNETMHGYSRYCTEFTDQKIDQQKIAKNIMEGILPHKIMYWEKIDDIKETLFGKFIQRTEDPVLQQAILDEIIKAEKLKKELYQYELGHNNFGKSFQSQVLRTSE